MAFLPTVGVIALSVINEEKHIANALDAGIKGYILKSAPIPQVIAAVKSVYNNEPFY